jgi:YggT family protein
MFVLGNFFIALAKVLDYGLTIFYWLMLARVLISWVNPDPYNPIVQFLYRITEPVLEPIRRRMPMMAVDFSPIIAFVAIMFLQSFLVRTIFDLGVRLRLR